MHVLFCFSCIREVPALISAWQVSVFVQDKWNYSDKFKFQLGIRGTDYNLHEKFYLDPRIGMKYHYSSDIAFKLNWGIYHQFLTTANNQDENLRRRWAI